MDNTKMDDTQKKRPTSITVIGWIFIVVAILMILSGGMGLLMFNLMGQMEGDMPPMPDEISAKFNMGKIIFENFHILAVLQIAFAIFTLITSIQFLKLRKWARNALEVVSWLGLIYIIGFGILWVISYISMSSEIPTHGISGPPPLFRIFGAVMGSVIIAVWSIPIIVIIRFLRGKVIKEAVEVK